MAACSFCLLAIEIWPGNRGAQCKVRAHSWPPRAKRACRGTVRALCPERSGGRGLERSAPPGNNRKARKANKQGLGPQAQALSSAAGASTSTRSAEMDLRRTRRGWEEPSPSQCPECGAELGPNQVLVGVAHCRCGEMHRSHFCRRCEHTIYTPPLDDSCAFQSLDGR